MHSSTKLLKSQWSGIIFVFALTGCCFLACLYGVAQLYETQYTWLCKHEDCLSIEPNGVADLDSVATGYTTRSVLSSSQTFLSIFKFLMFEIIAICFLILIIYFIQEKCCTEQWNETSLAQRCYMRIISCCNCNTNGNTSSLNAIWKTKCNSCVCGFCQFYFSVRTWMPSRYSGRYSACLLLISIQFKRVLFQSLFLCEIGGFDVINELFSLLTIDNIVTIDTAQSVDAPQNVLLFAIILGTNSIVTSFLYAI